MKFNSVSKNTRAYLNSDNLYLQEDSTNVGAGFKEPPLVVGCKDICKDTSIAAECEESSNAACGGCKESSTDVVAECIEPLIAACGGRKDEDGDGKLSLTTHSPRYGKCSKILNTFLFIYGRHIVIALPLRVWSISLYSLR